jgi:hypothetical protein
MRGLASLPRRLARMERQRSNRQLEATIAVLAEEYGLHPGEVRHALEETRRRTASYGPEPVETVVQRLAAEFGLDPAELRAEAERSRERLRARGVAV